MTRRIRIHIGVGDILQLVGIAGACIAVGHLAGLWWGVLLGAIFVVVDANLSYGRAKLTIALPSRWDVIRLRSFFHKRAWKARQRGRSALEWVRS